MKVLSEIVRFFRWLLLGLFLIFWLVVIVKLIQGGRSGLLVWFYSTVYENTLYIPPQMEWRPVFVVFSVYLVITLLLCFFEVRTVRRTRIARKQWVHRSKI